MKNEHPKTFRVILISGIILVMVSLVAVASLLDIVFPGFRWENETLLSTIEIMEVMVAIFMALILLYGQYEEGTGRTFWMAMGLISMALLNAFPASTRMECSFAWLYSLSGLIGGYWFSNVWIAAPGRTTIMKRLLPWLVVTGSLLIGVWILMFCESLPLMVEQGEFTTIAFVFNFTAGIFFLAAACRFLIDFYNEGDINSYLFSCISLLFAAASFMFKHSTLWNAQWWFWHFLHLMAYIVATGFVFSNYLQMIRTLKIAIADNRQVANALRENEEKFRSFFENSQDVIFISSKEGRFTDINPAGVKLFGYGKPELLTMNILNIYCNPFDRARYIAEMEKHGFVKDYEVDFKNRDGTRIYALTTAIVRRNRENEITGYQGIIRDVTARRQINAQLKRSLGEKEAMLKEIHHRVKNNLQIVSSLLNLQSENIHDDKLKEIFRESMSRIKSMSLIHEELYMSKDLARIDFAQYVKTLTANLFRSFGVDPDSIRLRINIDNVPVSIETAVPCGLIINELVSNSLKYAFPIRNAVGGEVALSDKQEISVSLVRGAGDELVLTIGDSGTGFPANMDFRRMKSLGLQLVSTLVAQLNGTIELDRSRGTKYEIRFSQKRVTVI
ncbi:MAG: PAS domain S-box protein [Deltaproteobacteria bacterium]|nr:PAS domain S-box protein [Deltaproteobacteria bacterium]